MPAHLPRIPQVEKRGRIQTKKRRKGSGRKKGKSLKELDQESPEHRVSIRAYSGKFRLGTRRLYDRLRTLALYSENRGAKSSVKLHREIARWMETKSFPREIFEILFVIVRAMQKRDADFFKDFAVALEKWNANDHGGNNLGHPADDPEIEWLLELACYYRIPPFPPLFYSNGARFDGGLWPPEIQKKLDMPLAERPPLTLREIQQFLRQKLGYELSLSSICTKAKIVKLPVHGRFGR